MMTALDPPHITPSAHLFSAKTGCIGCIVKRELPLIGITVRALSNGRLRIVDKVPVTFGDHRAEGPADVTDAIELDLRGGDWRDG